MLIVVAGTGTEVGKTWVGAALCRELRARDHAVRAYKPAQSFDPRSNEPTDADLLAAATGVEPHDVCPPQHWYDIAMAPPIAAAVLGRPPFTIAMLSAPITDSAGTITIVESAGGVASPLADDGDTAVLCALLRPQAVLLVAPAGLGTINAVRLSAAALRANAPGARLIVHLNRFDPDDLLHRTNREWLRARDGFDTTESIGALADALLSR
jgi:dethiobiotin synthetase